MIGRGVFRGPANEMQQGRSRKSAAIQTEIIRPNHVFSCECQVDMWFQIKLYEFLPVLYGISGLVTFHKFNTVIGYASGILLILTACLVSMMRKDYRQAYIKKRKLKH